MTQYLLQGVSGREVVLGDPFECVQLGPNKSPWSVGNGACVEVEIGPGVFTLRDTKQAERFKGQDELRPQVVVSFGGWSAFRRQVGDVLYDISPLGDWVHSKLVRAGEVEVVADSGWIVVSSAMSRDRLHFDPDEWLAFLRQIKAGGWQVPEPSHVLDVA